MTSILELPNGLHEGVPEAVYHARTAGLASKSVLEMVDRAPALYEAWLGGATREESPVLAFGKAFHCALLEPDVFRRTYTVEPKFGDCRKPDNKKARDDWRATNAGRQVIEQVEAIAIDGMVKSVLAHKRAGKLFDSDGVPELTMRWTDEETGIICKGRADLHLERLGVCVDVKTCDDARAPAFTRSVANYGYHRQDAFYDDGFRSAGAPLDHFLFVAVEKRAPYLVGLFNLDDDAVAEGRDWSRSTLQTFADCIERGEFPGYDTAIQTLSLPAYARRTRP